MAKLYDQDGTPVDVPQDQIAAAIRAGYGVKEPIQVTAPDGTVGTIDTAQGVFDAAQGGYKFESIEQETARVQQESYGSAGGEAAAGILGGLRGLSFGVSDKLLTETGLVSQEDIRGLKEANPKASMTGELGAIGAALLVPGGQGAAAAKIAGLGKGVRAVSKVGIAAEKAALKALTMGGAEAGTGTGVPGHNI